VSRSRIAIVLGAALLTGGAVVWARRQRSAPSACPYSQRFFLDLPRPFLRRERLLDILAPMPGERVLEIGPGTGYYSLHTARTLAPSGRLVILDLQPAMLDETTRRADAQGIANIEPLQGDAQELPFPDGTFDAAFLVATLGEIPDQVRALRELRRVLKPGGRLVVGEGQPDPHHVRLDDLRERAEAAGLSFVAHDGGQLGYLARFENEGDVG
jgi:ubiquinone/menaquinone biosynthesis C-methylase UbiE